MTDNHDPFPGPNINTAKSPWIDRWVEAVQADVPAPANEQSLRHLGRAAVGVKGLLTRHRDGTFHLRDLEEIDTPDGTLFAIRTVVPTPTLVPSPINDRIDYLFDTSASDGSTRPRRPRHQIMASGDGTPATGIAWTAADIGEIRSTAKAIADQLERLDGMRSWDLQEDLLRRGQQEPSLAYLGTWSYPNPDDPDDTVIIPTIEVTRGNNRAYRALQALGLDLSTGILGIPRASYQSGHTKGDRERNWHSGLAAWSTYYNDLRDVPLDDADTHSVVAHRAHRVATTPLLVVIGSTAPSVLPQSLSATNVGEHLHPPLSFDPSAEHTSAFALLAAAYRRAGRIDSIEEARLTGRLPTEEGEELCEAEDRLRQRMLKMVFPLDPEDQAITREALSEPPRNRLTRNHVERRSRVLAAADARIRNAGGDVNPRSGEVYLHSDAVSGVAVHAVGLTDLLVRAEGGDGEAFRHLVRDRAWPLFAVANLAGADRGSLGEVRRAPRSVVQALERQPERTLGLIREMIDARNARLGLRPNQVDEHGEAVPATVADRAWFDSAFPKPAKSDPKPDTTPGTDEADPMQTYLAAQVAVTAAVHGVTAALLAVGEEVQQLEVATRGANLQQPMSPEAVTLLVKALDEARDEIKPMRKQVHGLALLIDLEDEDDE